MMTDPFSVVMDAAFRLKPKVVIDARGHDAWRFERELEDGGPIQIALMLRDLENPEVFTGAWETGTPLEIPVPIHTSRYSHECGYCKQYGYTYDGFTIKANEPCPHPDGYTITAELAVPSGQLVVGNDFRDVFSVEESDFNVNAPYGIKETIEAFEEIGMLHFFVGNSCPGVYRTANQEFVIASAGYEEGSEKTIHPKGSLVASVCTDLWWVSIADRGIAERRGMVCDQTYIDTVPVTPGLYELTYHAIRKDFEMHEYHQPNIYADLKLKRAYDGEDKP